ncbi:hypothetical protein MMC30_000626 [Trapelia coarctata]|nr:hypothetical protein [Trapelia coarctata]
MSGPSWAGEAIVPARLSFLTLYNPSLGHTDETLHDQIVYYHSSKSSRNRRPKKYSDEDSASREHEEQNERLRQIGLAQGMVEFAKAFSNGENLDSIDSEKSRIMIHELEPGWWILASIDLTRIQSTPDTRTSQSNPKETNPTVEYSSREVCPQALLLQHLLRAHAVFILHHASSLEDLYARLSRQRFCGALERFWNRFIRDWDVLLHGNPAVDIYNGMKLAAGGELGIGVGEEDWGSGEREVLEDFIRRTEGVVDLVVSRFGEPSKEPDSIPRLTPLPTKGSRASSRPWLASGAHSSSADGVIFSGIGAVTRSSVRNVSAWVEWLYKYGQAAYGVQDSPHSAPRKKRRKTSVSEAGPLSDEFSARNQQREPGHKGQSGPEVPKPGNPSHFPPTIPGIPPPIIVSAERSLEAASSSATNAQKRRNESQGRDRSLSSNKEEKLSVGTETLMKYVTLGIYGSSWGIPAGRPPIQRRLSSDHPQDSSADELPKLPKKGPLQEVEPKPVSHSSGKSKAASLQRTIQGSFMIGLHGDLENEGGAEEEEDVHGTGTDRGPTHESDEWNSRISVRTVYVERNRGFEGGSGGPRDPYYDRLRVVVYIRQPFIFTFLFELQTESLSMSSFYRSLHHQLGPLQRPLLVSTAPSKVYERLWEAADPKSTSPITSAQPIYDLVYDPSNLTIHTTIPSIPDSGTPAAEGLEPTDAAWTRIEALNVHSQILNTYISTRRHLSELESTCKTNRGWWVVWMRLPLAPLTQHIGVNSFREAFLIRKASDYKAPAARKASSRFGLGSSEGSSGWGPAKLAEGIGIDTKRYIEGLLSLNR